MGDLRSFSKSISLRGDTLEKNVQKLMRKLALSVDTTVVMSTPVDTGRAAANWQLTFSEPAAGVLPVPSAKELSSRENITSASELLRSYAGQEIHIANNLPYIRRLNEGWSDQAPAGFVEACMAAGHAVVQKSAKRLLSDSNRGNDDGE